MVGWEEITSQLAEDVLGEFAEAAETLVDGLAPADLTTGQLRVWLRKPV